MSLKSKFLIVALGFFVGSAMIIYVVTSISHFWLLIPGVICVAIFGPWSYYLYAKVKGGPKMTNEQILAQAQTEFKTKDMK